MKEEKFKIMFPDLYNIWNIWNAKYNYSLNDEIIDLMIDIRNAITADMSHTFKERLTPTFLISKLAEFGYKGIVTREDPIYNSNISDKPIGNFQEILKID